MDDWLGTLIGGAIIGGAIYITGKEAKKQGYAEAMEQVQQNMQQEEIKRLREELNILKNNQKLIP